MCNSSTGLVDDPDCTKKRRKAEGQDQDVDVERFSDLVLPSSQSCLCVSIASSDGEEEELKQQAEGTSLGQGGRTQVRRKTRLTRRSRKASWSRWRQTWGPVAHTHQATMDQGWDKELREIRRMIEFLVNRERKLDIKTDVAARRLERLEKRKLPVRRRGARGQSRRSPNGQHQSREADRRQVVCRQGFWLW